MIDIEELSCCSKDNNIMPSKTNADTEDASNTTLKSFELSCASEYFILRICLYYCAHLNGDVLAILDEDKKQKMVASLNLQMPKSISK
jgi:hypothetical protein